MADGGGGEGAEGGGNADWRPIYDRVEAMVSKSQARAKALAADRGRVEAADRVQRESWEVARRLQRSVEELQAAAREKDVEMDRLRAEAADARKKLQADAGRKMRWEAAYVDLLIGANEKLAELRDSDLEDSRTCAETPNSKEVGRCAKLNEDTVDHIASDLRAELGKLKQAYETLTSKKDKEVCALLLEKDSLCNQLDIMQRDYAELLKSKKVDAAQTTEAALKLQQSVRELKELAQKKDGEIVRLQAEVVGAKKRHGKDLSALVSEKDSVHKKLSIMQQDYTELLRKKKVLTQKKDREIVILRSESVGAKKEVQKMHSLLKEKDDEIQTLKGRHPDSVQKHNKDISETYQKSRSGNRAVRDNPENSGSGSDEDGDKQTANDEDGDEQSGSGQDGDERSGSGEDCDVDDDNDKQSGSNKETPHNQVQKPLGNPKRKRDAYTAQVTIGKRYNNECKGFSEDEEYPNLVGISHQRHIQRQQQLP